MLRATSALRSPPTREDERIASSSVQYDMFHPVAGKSAHTPSYQPETLRSFVDHARRNSKKGPQQVRRRKASSGAYKTAHNSGKKLT